MVEVVKKSKPKSPTARTLEKLRALGFTAGTVERWNAYAKIRIDLFGFADLVAVHPEAGIFFIQACAGASHAARRGKILAEPRAGVVAKAGGKIEIFSWTKSGPAGTKKTWTLRREDLTQCLKNGNQ